MILYGILIHQTIQCFHIHITFNLHLMQVLNDQRKIIKKIYIYTTCIIMSLSTAMIIECICIMIIKNIKCRNYILFQERRHPYLDISQLRKIPDPYQTDTFHELIPTALWSNKYKWSICWLDCFLVIDFLKVKYEFCSDNMTWLYSPFVFHVSIHFNT